MPLTHIPIQSADIRSVYKMDCSPKLRRRSGPDKNPRMERIKRKVIEYLRAKANENADARR